VEGQVFQRDVRKQPQGAWDQREQQQNRQHHRCRVSGAGSRNVNLFNAARVKANDR
jgi:hypothetical protein